MGFNDFTKSPPVVRITPQDANRMLEDWHYLGAATAIIVAYGNGEGCLAFGNCRSRVYQAKNPKAVELVRMAAKPGHRWSMSSFMAMGTRLLRKDTDYDIVVTYADPNAGHDGAVYRAANWEFDGLFHPGHHEFYIDGKRVSPRTLYDRHGTQSVLKMREIYGDRLATKPTVPKARFIFRLNR